jgi:hypothetical protein
MERFVVLVVIVALPPFILDASGEVAGRRDPQHYHLNWNLVGSNEILLPAVGVA